MAPSTRSKSASNTPVKGSGSDAGTMSPEPETSFTPTRKTPRCSKCHRPRTGHPRSGCPFVDSDDSPPADSPNGSKGIEDALGSMTITSKTITDTPNRRGARRSLGASLAREPIEMEDTKKAIRERRKSQREAKAAAAALAPAESLVSITTEDLEAMLCPTDADYSDDGEGVAPEESKDEKIVHWPDGVLSTPKRNTRTKMPGSFNSPSPWSSFASIPGDTKSGITGPSSQISSTDSVSTIRTGLTEIASSSAIGKGQSPVRTMFAELLDEVSTARAYLLSKAELSNVSRCVPSGLYTRTLMDEDGDQNVLVVGRDEKDTEALYEKLSAEKARRARRGSGLRAVAGGAVVGAVATFTGLAFT